MYLRTTSRKNKDGSVVEYYALAHNERHPETDKPVPRIIHSFGRANHLDREGERRRRYILCYHPEEAERQKKHREQKIRFLEEGLKRHPARQANAQWVIELPASSRYKRYICL